MKVVAKALIIDGQGKLLLLYRGTTHPNFPGHLDLPGGEVEESERWDNAVAREIQEETALIISSDKLKKVLEKPYPHVTHVLYTARLSAQSPEPILSWEHSGYKWYSLDDLLKEPSPAGLDIYYTDMIQYISNHPAFNS